MWRCGWRTRPASWFVCLALWGTKSKYYPDLSTLWAQPAGKPKQLKSVTRATRSAGKYELVWDGLDEATARRCRWVHTASSSRPIRSTEPMPSKPARSASATAPPVSRCRRPPTSTPVVVQYGPQAAAMKHVVRVVAHWALLFHIYISMAGFTLAVLFGATGLALNHQDFGFERSPASPHRRSPSTSISWITRIRPRSNSALRQKLTFDRRRRTITTIPTRSR